MTRVATTTHWWLLHDVGWTSRRPRNSEGKFTKKGGSNSTSYWWSFSYWSNLGDPIMGLQEVFPLLVSFFGGLLLDKCWGGKIYRLSIDSVEKRNRSKKNSPWLGPMLSTSNFIAFHSFHPTIISTTQISSLVKRGQPTKKKRTQKREFVKNFITWSQSMISTLVCPVPKTKFPHPKGSPSKERGPQKICSFLVPWKQRRSCVFFLTRLSTFFQSFLLAGLDEVKAG